MIQLKRPPACAGFGRYSALCTQKFQVIDEGTYVIRGKPAASWKIWKQEEEGSCGSGLNDFIFDGHAAGSGFPVLRVDGLKPETASAEKKGVTDESASQGRSPVLGISGGRSIIPHGSEEETIFVVILKRTASHAGSPSQKSFDAACREKRHIEHLMAL